MQNLPQFNIVDMAAMALMTIGLIRGVMKGLSRELAGVISTAAALFAGWRLFDPVGAYLAGSTRLQDHGARMLAFLLVLVAAYLLMRVLRLILRSIMEFSFKGNIERVGGGIAGLLRVSALVAAVILAMALSPYEPARQIAAEESLFGRTLYSNLGPVYESLSEKYPVLKMPGGQTEPEDGCEFDFDDEDDHEARERTKHVEDYSEERY